MPQKEFKYITFDFDGVMAVDSGWLGCTHFGEPIPGMRELFIYLRADGWKVIIFSTRGSAELEDWCTKYDFPWDYINVNPEIIRQNPGKPCVKVMVDDRAICFNGDVEVLKHQIETFEPWHGRQ